MCYLHAINFKLKLMRMSIWPELEILEYVLPQSVKNLFKVLFSIKFVLELLYRPHSGSFKNI